MSMVVRAVVIALALVVRAARADTVVVDDSFEELSLGKHLELAYDPTGALSLDDVLAGKLEFTPSTKEVPSFGYRSGSEWVRLELRESRAADAKPLILECSHPLYDDIEVHFRGHGSIQSVRLGRHVERDAWPLAGRLPAVNVPLGTTLVIGRFSSSASHQLPLVLRSAANFQRSLLADMGVHAGYYGALLAILLYNFVIFLVTRLRVYGLYVTSLASFAVFTLSLNGTAHRLGLWSNAWPGDHLFSLSLGVYVAVQTRFVLELLGLGRYRPGFERFGRSYALALLVWTVLTVALPVRVGMRMTVIIGLLAVPFNLSAGVLSVRLGERAGRYHLLAWTVLLLALVLLALKTLGFIAANALTTNAYQVGSTIEFVLLSLGLADRIKQLQGEAMRNAELAAASARAAEEATARALAEQERANAELQRMDKLKDAFLANTSHELRTPLNGILGLVETTLGGSVGAIPSPVKRNLELVRASGRRLTTLVNDILDFSKLREKTVTLREKPVAIHSVVEMTLQTLTPLAADKGLRLVNEVPESLGARADENRLQQILTNLIGNAIKFTHEGHVAVQAVEREGRVVVRVQDTGIGIAKEAQARIFESFEQADGSTSREYGGTGLGLAVTKQLVELHGGHVVLESEVGRGSTFSFDLLREDVPTEVAQAARVALGEAPSMARLGVAEESEREPVVPQDLRVLVVDDEPINREVLAQHLAAKGFDVLHAQDGVQAIERIEMEKPDVVLLDVMMPKKNGYDVLEAVRPKLEATELPVLLLTAKAQESDLKLGFSLGASDYLLKPVSFVELDARLGHHAKLVRAVRAQAAELEERRRLQGELDVATQQLTQAENMATLGMLMAGIAHDLRNPLNYVQGAAEQLRAAIPNLQSDDEAVRAKTLGRVEKVVGWVEQGTASMDAISLAMRNQARSGGAELEDVNVRDVVNEALLLCRSRTKVCEVEIDVQDATIRADATGLGQLVMNLVSNAADAITEAKEKHPDHARKIRVSARVGGDAFMLAVEDSGPGIPEHVRARILEPFFTTKPRGQGTGLGLAIVQRVVKQHEGTLEIGRSDALGGASFEARWRLG